MYLTLILSAAGALVTAASVPLVNRDHTINSTAARDPLVNRDSINATRTVDVVEPAGPIHTVVPPSDIHGGFWEDCWWNGYLYSFGRYYGTYTAQCPPPDASPFAIWDTLLSLNNCLVNTNGYMYWVADGHAMDSCSNCKSDPGNCYMITCDCDSGEDNGHKLIRNRVNLNDGIYVHNGRLACMGIDGSLSIH